MREYVYMKRVKLAFEEPCPNLALYSWTDGIAVLFGVKGPFGLKAIIQAEFDGRSRGGIFTYTLGDRLIQTHTYTHTQRRTHKQSQRGRVDEGSFVSTL